MGEGEALEHNPGVFVPSRFPTMVSVSAVVQTVLENARVLKWFLSLHMYLCLLTVCTSQE